MTGHRPWSEIRRGAKRSRSIEEIRREVEEEQRAYRPTLAEVRIDRHVTQQQLAAALDTQQPQVSHIERQEDWLLSTLARYLEAIGGRLEVVAVFGDERVPLDLGELAHARAKGPSKRRTATGTARKTSVIPRRGAPTIGASRQPRNIVRCSRVSH